MDRFVRALAVVAVATLLLAFATLPAAAVDEPTPAPEPTPVMITLTGTVVGADGGPIEVREAWIEQEWGNGEISVLGRERLEVAEDGSFTVAVYASGTKDNPKRVEIDVYGPLTGREVEGDCEYQLGLYGEWQADVALAEGDDPSPITVVVDREVRVGGGCAGSTVEPGPTDDPGATGEPTPIDEPTVEPEPTPVEPLIVVEDATVTVAVALGGSSDPVAGAAVTLQVIDPSDGEDPIQTWEGSTDESGQIAFDGVARPGEGGRPLTWVVEASATVSERVDGCLLAFSVSDWLSADAAAGSHELRVAVVPDPESVTSSECDPPGEGAPVLAGMVVAPEGNGLEVTLSRYLQQRADGATWGGDFEVAADGSFSIVLQAWGTGDAVSVLQVEVAANREETTTPDGCTEATEDSGHLWLKLALAEGMPLEPVELVLETRTSGVCGAVGTPRPEPGATDDGAGTGGEASGDDEEYDHGGASGGENGGTQDTLPPTDRPSGPGGPSGPTTAFLALMLVLALAAVLVGSARRHPHRSR